MLADLYKRCAAFRMKRMLLIIISIVLVLIAGIIVKRADQKGIVFALLILNTKICFGKSFLVLQWLAYLLWYPAPKMLKTTWKLMKSRFILRSRLLLPIFQRMQPSAWPIR